MSDQIPDDVIYEALRELDDPGEQAAEWFATGFEQIASRTGRAGNLIAYCGREALMALLRLGGVRPPGLGEAVDKVLAVVGAVSSQDEGLNLSVRKPFVCGAGDSRFLTRPPSLRLRRRGIALVSY